METPSVKCRKSQPTPYTFEGFMRPPALVLGAIGLVFWPNTNYWANKWQVLKFVITLFSVSTAIMSQFWRGIEFFVESKNLIEGTQLMIYLLYAILSEIKILCVFKNLKRINNLISILNDIFPVTNEQMMAFNVRKYHRRVLLLTIPVTFVMWFNVSFFSMITFMFFLKTEPENFDSILQFYFWYPFEINTTTRFIGAFIQQVHAAQGVTLCVLGSDALLTCILLQVCMHLDQLSSRLEKKQTGAEDIKDLSDIIHKHDAILRLMDEVNEIFASPVFITFLSSAFVMCFVEFQVVIGASGVHILQFALFLTYEVLKIFQTSLLGDMLMEASLNIGETAYRSNWYDNSVQYQKVILLIICRAQRQANLNAITLHEVCLITFKEIISKSYTFFTLLRTMYTN